MERKVTIVTGISRDPDFRQQLVLQLRREASDSEMQAFHDLLNPPSSRDLANIEGDEIVIRVPVSAVPHAASVAFESTCGEAAPKVTDAAVFAREIVRELNNEEEDGTTPIHRLFDAACNAAADQGAEGLSEI